VYNNIWIWCNAKYDAPTRYQGSKWTGAAGDSPPRGIKAPPIEQQRGRKKMQNCTKIAPALFWKLK